MTRTNETFPTDNPVATILAAYRAHASTAYAVAWRVTHDRDLAAEAVQDAFLSLWRIQASHRAPQGDVGALLHTIAHRRAVDLIRQNVRHPKPIALHLVAQQLMSPDTGPEEHACRAEDVQQVRNAVFALPPNIRKPLVLAYYYGLTYPEIAGELGVPLGTVKTRIGAARRDLRTLLVTTQVDTLAG